MPRSNARTCRPGHAARLAPRLTAAQVLLVVGVVWMGMPAVTRARPEPQRAAPPDNPLASSLWASSDINRTSRSLSDFRNVKNLKWLLQKEGHFIVIEMDGNVTTTRDVKPRLGVMLFGAHQDNASRGNFFSRSPEKMIVTIKGQATNRYLCMNRRGVVYASPPDMRTVPKECGFLEIIPDHNFNTYCQERRTKVSGRTTARPPPGRRVRKRKGKNEPCEKNCLGVTKHGKIRKGSRTCFNHESAKFSLLKVEDPDKTDPEVLIQFPTQPTLNATTRPPGGTPTKKPGCKGRKKGRKWRKKGCGRRKPKPVTTAPPCKGLFCKMTKHQGEERGDREPKRRGRDHQGRGRRRQRRRRRRKPERRSDRPRRAQGTPEVGPLSDVT